MLDHMGTLQRPLGTEGEGEGEGERRSGEGEGEGGGRMKEGEMIVARCV